MIRRVHTLIGHPNDLVATLLHEAAHAVLYEADLDGGVSENGYYHTKKFRDQCLTFGLTCQFRDTRHGWNITAWPGGRVPDRFRPVVDALRVELPAGTGDPKPRRGAGKALPPPGLTTLRCGCPDELKRVILVKKSVLRAGGVRCDLCGEGFADRTLEGS